MKHDERGLTLVELLAVLVLISLVTGIIWTAMTISIKHNAQETTKLQLQQEANLIITKLQEIHRHNDCYRLTINKDLVEVNGCSETMNTLHEVLGDEYSYEAVADLKGQRITITTEEIKPNEDDLKLTKFYVKEKTKGNAGNILTVNVPTTISKIKNTYEEEADETK